MASLKKLNSRERKKFHQQLQEQYGYTGKLEYEFFLNENKRKYFILSSEAAAFSTEGMRVETYGMYVARGMPDGLRLTIEGSQLIGPECDQQILELDDEQANLWLRGNDLDVGDEVHGWLLIKHNDDYIGSGKVVKKEREGKTDISLHNYIPKARYVRG